MPTVVHLTETPRGCRVVDCFFFHIHTTKSAALALYWEDMRKKATAIRDSYDREMEAKFQWKRVIDKSCAPAAPRTTRGKPSSGLVEA